RGPGSLGTPPARVPIQLRQITSLALVAVELSAAIRVEPVPASASVAIDAVAVGRGTWEGDFAAGPHRIEVAATGFLPAAQEVELSAGERRVVRVALQRDPASPFWRKPPR